MVTRWSVQGLALAGALLWGGCLLVLGLINLAVPAYGHAFLQGVGSVYPGFYQGRTFANVLVGTAYGVVDGGLGGALLAWLYNAITGV
jgi:hypothetical protein